METNKIQQIKLRYGVVGNNDGLMRALETALMVASTDMSVFVVGESGVGKEVIPRIIHDNSRRKHNKYLAINCGSIPEGTIDSELFGHAKGAFTGAIGERDGYFGEANGGTLFLDEVGELPLATQARLLRVLETGEYIRVGESIPRKTNVRIVAATNVNIEKAIVEGKFRCDLYYRLCAIPIKLPPLRERGEDIALIFRKFASEISEKEHFTTKRLSQDAKELLLKYTWPGNIRELRNFAERISITCDEDIITADILRQEGITDDSLVGTSIIATTPIPDHHHTPVDDPLSWKNEREQVYLIIGQLTQEVKNLSDYIYGNAAPQPQIGHTFTLPQHPQPYSPIEDMEEANDDEEENQSVSLRDSELRNIKMALERNNGNRRKASLELGISERTLYRKLKDYGLVKD